jgi:CDGSH-type Zn-finger protein
MSEPVKIKMIPNGPLRVQTGTFEIELANGTSMSKEAPFSFCRCGNSSINPFCDGTHLTCGFKG